MKLKEVGQIGACLNMYNRMLVSSNNILIWVSKVAYLNILWILFTFLGGVLLGGFPATFAAMHVVRKWLNGHKDIKIWSTFKNYFKKEFFISNKVGIFLSLVGAVLILNYYIIISSPKAYWIGTIFAFYILVFLYFTMFLWVIPLMVLFENSFLKHLLNSIIIGILNIHYTIGLIFIIFVIIYFSLHFPGVIPFFTISIIIFVWCWMIQQGLNGKKLQ